MRSKIEKGKAPCAAGESPAIDPAIWSVIAGMQSNFLPAGSSVYYFSDGHAEQIPDPPEICPFSFLCHLTAVNLHSDPTTEQVFATFTLNTDFSSPATGNAISGGDGSGTFVAITLTKEDTKISSKTFLKLPGKARRVFGFYRPGDDVVAYDLNKRPWSFRHVLTGFPYCHLLTEGWSSFILNKLLVAGDVVVFVRDDEGTIFVGCRRCPDDERDLSAISMEASTSQMTNRMVRKTEEAEVLLEAGRWAEEDGAGMVEVRYYPDNMYPMYLLKKEVVDNAMSVPWEPGMTIMKRWPQDDGSVFEALGTVKTLTPEAQFSPWRMLEIKWDESPRDTFENPWDVSPATRATPAHIITVTSPEEEVQKKIKTVPEEDEVKNI